jgi:hypothetical protein
VGKNMIMLAIVSSVTGAVLAQRFKIMILIPATAIALAAALGTGVAQTQTAWWTIVMAAAAGVSMQVGYIIGLCIHYVVEAPLTERPDAFRPGASARHPVR